MKVKVRAVIVHDGKLVVSRERRQGIEHVLLPGGRVQSGESVPDALVREVAEETGLDVVPVRLLYVAEVVGSYGAHDVNLIWLAELTDGESAIDSDTLVALDSPEARSIMPPIIDRIAVDAARGWPEQLRWLGNVRRPPVRPSTRERSAESGRDQQ
ncbi:MAG TPA: NUDIX domain-containing protein [Solirubrobacteraceae bacterium]|nr:NUDIX domain-containing protein [Solirubrobacteraceae bacterium]